MLIEYLLSDGNYSSLTVLFRFEREVGHYIMDYYVPSMLLVVVSWVSFWLDPNAVPGRTTLGEPARNIRLLRDPNDCYGVKENQCV